MRQLIEAGPDFDRDGVIEYRVKHIRDLALRHFGADYSRSGMQPEIVDLLDFPGIVGADWGRRPKHAEKHAKEPDFSRISSASLCPRQLYQETGDFAACSYCGQLGLAGMSAFRLANCTQQLGGLTPGIILRPTRHLL